MATYEEETLVLKTLPIIRSFKRLAEKIPSFRWHCSDLLWLSPSSETAQSCGSLNSRFSGSFGFVLSRTAFRIASLCQKTD